jgi:hypothetical protein
VKVVRKHAAIAGARLSPTSAHRDHVPFSRDALSALASGHSIRVEDKTSVGGSFFVYLASTEGPIAEQLRRWGFRYGPNKRAWYRKG